MVHTAGGIPVSPATSAGNNVMTTASAQQSFETPLFHPAKSPGLQLAPQALTLTPQMDNLNISSAASQLSQKLVAAETSIAKSNQTVQTVEAMEISQQISSTATVAEINRKYLSPAQTRQSHDEKTSSSQVPEKETSAKAMAVDRENHRPRTVTLLGSDNEVL